MNLEPNESERTGQYSQVSTLEQLWALVPRLEYSNDRIFITIFFVYLVLPLLFTPYLVAEVYEAPKAVLFMLAFGVILLSVAYSKKLKLRISKPLLVCFGGFALWVVLSTVTSLDPILSFVGLVGRNSNSSIFLLLWAGWVMILLGVLTEDRWWYLTRTIYLGGFVIAGYSILQLHGIGYYAGLENVTRVIAPGLLGNPNFNGMYLAGVVPLGILLFNMAHKFRTKVWLILSGVVILWSLVLTSSRAAILGVLVALVVQLVVNLISARKLNYSLTTLGAMVLVVIFSWLYLPVLRPGDVAKSVNFQETNQEYRLIAWDLAMVTIKDHPWFGTGITNFHLDFKSRGWSVFSSGERFDDPHNILLLLASNGGLPLLGFFLGILLLAGSGFFRLRKGGDVTVATTIGALIGLLVTMLFGPVVIACWLLLAFFVASLLYKDLPTTVWKLSKFWRVVISVLGSLLILLTVCWFVGQVLAYQSAMAFKHNQLGRANQLSRIGYTLNFTSGQALRNLVLSRIELGHDPVGTAALIAQAVERHENDSTFLMDSAPLYYFLWKQSKDTKYLDLMSQAIENAIVKEPRFSRLYSQAAYLEFKSGDTAKALEYQRLSLTYNSEQTYGWVLLSKLYYDLNRREQTIASMEQAYLHSNETLVLKNMLSDFKRTDNIQSVPFAVFFPEPQK
jgi:O-antigen ligase